MNANNSEIYFFIINSMHISDIYQSTVKYCNNNFNQKVQRGLSFNCSCIQVMTYMVTHQKGDFIESLNLSAKKD